MDTKLLLEELKRKLESGEFNHFFDREAMRIKMRNSQVDRFHGMYGEPVKFTEIVGKVMDKYGSDGYYYRWMNRGILPPEPLLFFLFDYACKYGRGCNDSEFEKYGNMFTSGLYYIHGFYFNLMHGQGSMIRVHREGEGASEGTSEGINE